jgi:hypothetical protein
VIKVDRGHGMRNGLEVGGAQAEKKTTKKEIIMSTRPEGASTTASSLLGRFMANKGTGSGGMTTGGN